MRNKRKPPPDLQNVPSCRQCGALGTPLCATCALFVTHHQQTFILVPHVPVEPPERLPPPVPNQDVPHTENYMPPPYVESTPPDVWHNQPPHVPVEHHHPIVTFDAFPASVPTFDMPHMPHDSSFWT